MQRADQMNQLNDMIQQHADEASRQLQRVMDDVMAEIKSELTAVAEEGLITKWSAFWEPYQFDPVLRLEIAYATQIERDADS